MLKSASCLKCKHALPLRPKLTSFRLAPREIACPGCAERIPTTFMYRVTWMERVVWKVLFLAAVPFWIYLGITRADDSVHAALWITGGILLGSGLGGFILSRIFAFPTQLVVERLTRG